MHSYVLCEMLHYSFSMTQLYLLSKRNLIVCRLYGLLCCRLSGLRGRLWLTREHLHIVYPNLYHRTAHTVLVIV